MFEAWARILREAPHSSLWLHYPVVNADNVNYATTVAANLKRALQERGLDPNRYVLGGRTSSAQAGETEWTFGAHAGWCLRRWCRRSRST